LLAAVAGGLAVAAAVSGCVHVTPDSHLTRAPYLTAEFADRVTVNWATDRSSDDATLRWGRAPGCEEHVTRAHAVPITVRRRPEWQWRVDLSGLAASRRYCYWPLLDGQPLLPRRDSLEFQAAPARGDTRRFSFAVIGDWGQDSSVESNLLDQIGDGPARFLVTVGDNAYPSGDEDSYGDLGGGGVFGRRQLPAIGQRAVFAAQGNHGALANLPYLHNFPSKTVATASGGRFEQNRYCCTSAMGTSHDAYASAWYAFDWGPARFYVLESAWSDGPKDYQADYEAHWNGPVAGCAPCGAELAWLRRDLAAHPAQPKFAFFHYPLHVDSSAQRSDPFTSGAEALEGLLARSGVNAAFSGHAHVYERNLPQVGGLVTYVTGGGGGELSPVNACSAFDAFALGANTSCRADPPESPLSVFHYLLVTVESDHFTVTPTDATGVPFDQQTYNFDTVGPFAKFGA
jgi:hypothetical protein